MAVAPRWPRSAIAPIRCIEGAWFASASTRSPGYPQLEPQPVIGYRAIVENSVRKNRGCRPAGIINTPPRRRAVQSGRCFALGSWRSWQDPRVHRGSISCFCPHRQHAGSRQSAEGHQSTIQRRIAELEESLGRRLVEPHGGGYRLTELGQELQSTLGWRPGLSLLSSLRAPLVL
jgi:hypothetical protein